MSTATLPKAVLYYSDSVWSASVLLTLYVCSIPQLVLPLTRLREEKGYADDEVDRKIVDLGTTISALTPSATD
jgi:hypothetical protein